MLVCKCCGRDLTGRQRMYCSRVCKNKYTNQAHQSYVSQQIRGRERKIQLIRIKGNKCEQCGYDRNYAALEFHHKTPSKKTFPLDLRALLNRKWAMIVDEVEKCVLLCSNCHAEIHNPNCVLVDK